MSDSTEILKLRVLLALYQMDDESRSDEIAAMKDGRIIAKGNPSEIITSELIEQVYGVRLNVTQVDGKPYVLTV